MKDETIIYLVFAAFVIIWNISNNITLCNIIKTLMQQ